MFITPGPDKVKYVVSMYSYFSKMGKFNIGPVQIGECVQRIFKSICESAQADRSLSFPPEETLEPWQQKSDY